MATCRRKKHHCLYHPGAVWAALALLPLLCFIPQLLERKQHPVGKVSWQACLFLLPRMAQHAGVSGQGESRGHCSGHHREMGMPVGCSGQQSQLLAHCDLPWVGGHQISVGTLIGRPQAPSVLDIDKFGDIRSSIWLFPNRMTFFLALNTKGEITRNEDCSFPHNERECGTILQHRWQTDKFK